MVEPQGVSLDPYNLSQAMSGQPMQNQDIQQNSAEIAHLLTNLQ